MTPIQTIITPPAPGKPATPENDDSDNPILRLLFVSYRNKLQLWRLAMENKSLALENNLYHLDSPAGMILEMDFSQRQSYIQCADISQEGNFVAVSKLDNTSLYELSYLNTLKGLSIKVQKLDITLPPSVALCFNPTSKYQLIFATSSAQHHLVQIYHLKKRVLTHSFTFPISAAYNHAPISKLVVSPNGRLLAVIRMDQVVVYDLNSKSEYAIIPPFPKSVICIFSYDSESLILIVGRDIMLYMFSDFRLVTIGLSPGNCIGLSLYDNEHLHITDRDNLTFYNLPKRSIDRIIKKNEIIIYSSFINNEDIVTVNWKHNEFLQSLPPPFYRHIFGT